MQFGLQIKRQQFGPLVDELSAKNDELAGKLNTTVREYEGKIRDVQARADEMSRRLASLQQDLDGRAAQPAPMPAVKAISAR